MRNSGSAKLPSAKDEDLDKISGLNSPSNGLQRLFFEIEKEEKEDRHHGTEIIQTERAVKKQEESAETDLLNKELKLRTAELRESRVQLFSTQEQLAAAHRNISALQQELKNSDSIADNLKVALQVATDSIRMATEIRSSQRGEEDKEIDAYRLQIKALREAILQIERERNALSAKVKNLESQLMADDLKAQLKEAEKDKKILQRKLLEAELQASYASSLTVPINRNRAEEKQASKSFNVEESSPHISPNYGGDYQSRLDQLTLHHEREKQNMQEQFEEILVVFQKKYEEEIAERDLMMHEQNAQFAEEMSTIKEEITKVSRSNVEDDSKMVEKARQLVHMRQENFRIEREAAEREAILVQEKSRLSEEMTKVRARFSEEIATLEVKADDHVQQARAEYEARIKEIHDRAWEELQRRERDSTEREAALWVRSESFRIQLEELQSLAAHRDMGEIRQSHGRDILHTTFSKKPYRSPKSNDVANRGASDDEEQRVDANVIGLSTAQVREERCRHFTSSVVRQKWWQTRGIRPPCAKFSNNPSKGSETLSE